MNRPAAGAVGLLTVGVLVASLLSGCGGGPSYCGAVKDHQSDLGSIAHGHQRTALLQALPIFEDLQGKAPDDVADDWQLLVTRVRALDTALAHAGVDPATYDPTNPPAGLSSEDRGLIRRAAAQLAASDTQQAFTTVQQEVLDVCHTPLEL
jgi:hypothetical protein